MIKGIKRFLAVAACITVISNSYNISCAIENVNTFRGSADGTTNTLTIDNESGDTSTYVWADSDPKSVTITMNGGQLDISNYSSSNLNGVINAEAGNISLTSGVLTITGQSNIAQSVHTVINEGSTLSVTGGNVNLDSGTDVLGGNIQISSGKLTVDNIVKPTTGSFSQTGGETTVTGAFEFNNTEDNISGGTFNIGSSASSANMNFKKGVINSDANLNLKSNSDMNISDGEVNIDSTDNWEGNINVEGGTLNIDNNKKTGTLTQSNGTINVSGKDFDLNNSNDLLDGGSINIGDGTTPSQLNVSKGTITSNSSVTLNDKSTINISGGNVAIDADDTWGGTINMTEGSLAINGNNKTGKFTQTGGETTVMGEGFDLNNEYDTIDGGKLTIGNGINTANMGVSKGGISKNTEVNITHNSSLNITGGNVDLGDKTSWAGALNISSGNLTIDNTSKNSSGKFVQVGGNTTITGNGLDLNNSDDIINGGTVNIGDNISDSDLTVSKGTIDSNVSININNNGSLNITGGNVSLGNNSTWNGDVNISEGNLALIGIDKNSSGKFIQTGGKTELNGNFDLNNSEDLISDGTFDIGNKESSTLTVSKGNIESKANIIINNGSNMDITGGNVELDNGDTWNGNVNINNGTLNLNGVNNKNGIFTQTGGKTTVTGKGFDLNSSNDKIDGGDLQIGNGTDTSNMTVSNGTIGQNTNVSIKDNGSLYVTGGNVHLNNATKDEGGTFSQTAGTTTITGNFDLNNENDNIAGGNFNIGNDLQKTTVNISKGTIQKDATTNINTNATLNINGGKVTLDEGDSWKGNVNIDSGSLALVGINKNTSGKFTQTGGETTITGDSFDFNNSEDLISGGTINIGTDAENSTVTVSKGTIEKDASTNIASGSNLNITGGNITLDGQTDKFDGNVNVSGGNLNLAGIDKNPSGILNQTGGTINVTNKGNTLNNKNDIIAGGNLNIGTEKENGELTISQGTIKADSTVNISENSTLNIDGGTVALDKNDKWNGDVNVSQGTLNLNTGANKTTSSTSKFNQTGGITNINKDSKLTLNTSDSKITGGTVNIVNTGELDINNSSENSSEVNTSGGKFSIRKGSKYSVTKGNIESNARITVEEDATLDVNGDETNISLDGNNDKVDGHLKVSNGILNLSNKFNKTTTEKGSYVQTGGTTNISGESKLSLNDANSSITDGEINVTENSTLEINNGKNHSSKLNVTGSNFGIKGKSSFTIKEGTIDSDSKVSIESASKLKIDGENSNVNINKNDKWEGSIGLANGNLYISEDLTKVTDANGNYIQTGGNLNMSKANLILDDANSKISGGTVNITDNSILTVTKNGGSSITGGNIVIDDSSVLNYLAEKGLIKYSEGNQINIDTSGLINMANNVRTNNSINNLTINNGEYGDGQANFAIDLYARSNGNAGSDTFSADSIKVATKGENGTIHISDWNIAGDINGYDAPIEKHIRLGKIFKADDIDKEVTFTSTDKEIFTPIGYYRLNSSSANDGSYSLDLTRFNPQVFRGQVATAASYMNQLVVNDTLFNRAQIRRYGASYDQLFKNKTAILDGTASYERTLKEGSLWTEVFGNFETLKMNNSLDKVRNNSWGFIVGADFGLRELKNGWTYMPTAYIAYNGGHQTFNGVGMWENGGQIGFMSSWMKRQFIETAMIYGGVYGTEMSVAGTSEDAFNYFVGVASKTAYDWNLGKYFKIQPSLTLAYNMFGQQNWHSDFGQMGMSSGFLNGFNVAPGVNFIFQRETWSAYATIAYAWNFFAGIDGQAGYVDLPSIKMAQGYLQYGFGMTKTFSDRLNLFAQATVRNIGRTGIICQGGLNWRL